MPPGCDRAVRAVREWPVGPCAVGHRAASPARRPCFLNGARPTVSVRDAARHRRVARHFAPLRACVTSPVGSARGVWCGRACVPGVARPTGEVTQAPTSPWSRLSIRRAS
ncbi:hypothetical protein SNL152K_1472 [Streptomyces sp. NL15-2K]|nr:hypothetical protein SNL152K_1472 [Streptomyces sp. NL15-2K]